jgi:phosphoglycolate phosphatase-like HAD superfamily hydrolase
MPKEVWRPAPALVLFDIDGTLIRRAGAHHREALVDAVRRVTGIESTTDHIPVQGMLDRDIVRIMMRDAGASTALIRKSMPAIVAAAERFYARRCPDLRRRVCPGARGLLWRLFRKGIPTGLVTGNLTRIGWTKMERAGLRRYFRYGMFAEMAADRAALARLAIRQARREGWIGPDALVTLIGDHPNDVRAAASNGIRSVAVATGLSSRQELCEHSPHILLDDLRSLTLEMLIA